MIFSWVRLPFFLLIGKLQGVKIKLPNPLTCLRCGYVWTPRQVDVRICPKCKSAKWDIPKKK